MRRGSCAGEDAETIAGAAGRSVAVDMTGCRVAIVASVATVVVVAASTVRTVRTVRTTVHVAHGNPYTRLLFLVHRLRAQSATAQYSSSISDPAYSPCAPS